MEIIHALNIIITHFPFISPYLNPQNPRILIEYGGSAHVLHFSKWYFLL